MADLNSTLLIIKQKLTAYYNQQAKIGRMDKNSKVYPTTCCPQKKYPRFQDINRFKAKG